MKGESVWRGGGIAWGLALAGIAALYAWVSRQDLAVLLVPYGDAWAHLAAIRRTLDLGPFPGDLFYGGGASPPYYSLAHILFAAASRLSGLPPHQVWVLAPPWIAALDLAAVFVFLRRLTGDDRVAVLGAFLELFVRVPGPAWAALSFPRSVAVLPTYLACYAYVRGRPERRLGWLAAAGVLLGLSFDTHLYVGGLCAIGLALLDFALVPRRTLAPGPLAMTAAIALVVAAPWLGNFLDAWRHGPAQPDAVFRLSRHGWDFSIGGFGLHMHDPLEAYAALPAPLWLLVGLGVVVSLRRVRRGQGSAADRYALLGAGAAVLLLFTPLYGLAVAFLGVWSPRLLLVAPLPLLFGLGVAGSLDWLSAAAIAAPARRALQLAFALGLAWAGVGVFHEFHDAVAQVRDYSRALLASGPLGDWNMATRLAETGPLPKMILSDPTTSYDLVYLLGSYVVTMPAGHGSAFADHTPRSKAVRQFYRVGEADAQLLEILDRYGVDMVAIAPDTPWPDAGWGAELLARLRRHPAFVDTGCCGNVVFLRYRSG